MKVFERVMYSTSMVEADSNMDSIVCNTDEEAINSPVADTSLNYMNGRRSG